MLPVTEDAGGACLSREKERKKGLVGLVDVARRAGEYKVVSPVERRLSFTRCHVVERDEIPPDLSLTVRANRSMQLEEPLARFRIGVPRCG
jgi:hypothetical protein